jgi:FixJ family two-component response regulator
MPDMTGLELQQYLANSGLGISTQLTMNLVAESGASLLEPLSYLLKPLRKAALINAINDAIDDTR